MEVMSSVKEIEQAIQNLSPERLAEFRDWFAEFDAALWDRQIEQDVAAGRLNSLTEQALSDLRGGHCTEL
jgi:hypothetical protein